MTLRVAVDATAIPGHRVGVGVYVTELIAAMSRRADVDLHVFVNRRDAGELGALVAGATLHDVHVPNRPARLVWGHSLLPLRTRRIRPDVFHGPHYTVPAGLSCPGVVTFHDPTFFSLPEVHERSKVAYFTRAARSGIARAARVIAVSEYARRGAIEHAGADPAAVDMIHEGVDLDRYGPVDHDGTAFPFEPYALFVGAIEPRKDVPTLVAAYGEIAARGFPHTLVLVGPPAWGTAATDAAVARLAAGTVHRLSYVPEAEKIRLFRRAAVFVYPSVAEGFGLPVLEAMACGTPVVTTSGSAPEEVAGGAALIVPPRDTASLRDAIVRVIEDDELYSRLRRDGIERARAFTWTNAAERTIDTYRRAAAERP